MPSLNRRRFLKGAGTAGVAALAGCLGVGGGGSDKTTLQYWEYFHSQSEVANELLTTATDEFQQENDVNLQVNWASWSDINGGNGRTTSRTGTGPSSTTPRTASTASSSNPAG